MLGSFVIGGVAGLTLTPARMGMHPDVRIFLMVGICGGFTTFSAFSLQLLELLQNGDAIPALLYAAGPSCCACCSFGSAGGWAGCSRLSPRPEASVDPDRGGLRALGALHHVHPDGLTFRQLGHPGALQSGGMDEHVLPALDRRDEAKPLGGIIPLHGPLHFDRRARGRAPPGSTAAAAPMPMPPGGAPPGPRDGAPRGVAVLSSTEMTSETCRPFWP